MLNDPDDDDHGDDYVVEAKMMIVMQIRMDKYCLQHLCPTNGFKLQDCPPRDTAPHIHGGDEPSC